MGLPQEFETESRRIEAQAAGLGGYLTPRETRFLILLAAAAEGPGEILEIGSYKGRSTFVLAQATAMAGRPGIVAVDPLTGPAATDPAGYDDSVRSEFYANLERSGVAGQVEFHEKFSQQLAEGWERPLRMLWIDGDHSYRGALSDLELFGPHLGEGAFVAFHDTLSPCEGPIRVFMEKVLLSSDFGPAGFCGSIAWAQRSSDGRRVASFEQQRLSLYRRLAPMVRYVAFDRQPTGLAKLCYKLLRSFVPHQEPTPERWLAMLKG